MAAVSSFGYSGTNAHLVVAGHRPLPPAAAAAASAPQLIVLSGQRGLNLRSQAAALSEFLDREGEAVDLASLAFTLQTGRDAMDERLAVAVQDIGELREALAGFLGEPLRGVAAVLHRGSVRRDGAGLADDGESEARARRMRASIEAGDLESLADHWVRGGEVDWQRLHNGRPRRIGLPTYRFSRERYPLLWRAVAEPAAAEPSPIETSPIETSLARTTLAETSPSAAVSLSKDEPAVMAMTTRAAADGTEVMRFTEEWQPLPAVAGEAAAFEGTIICLLAEPSHRRAFTDLTQRLAPAMRIVFAGSVEELSEAVADAGVTETAAVLYLRPLETPKLIADSGAVAGLFKALHAAGVRPGRVLLVGACRDGLERSYLESWIGFERSMRLAWPGTQVQVLIGEAAPDHEDGAGFDAAVWCARIWAELCQPEARSVLYDAELRHELRIGLAGCDLAAAAE